MSEKDRLELEQECLLKYTKAQMIEKYIDELAENEIITEQWYKSQQENKKLKDGLHKILDLNKRAINCDSQKITIKYLLKQYDLIYETLGEIQPGLMKGDKK